MRTYGLGTQIDAFESRMNRAAEQAIREAAPIFVDAVKQMTLDDDKQIYSGGDSSATDYFNEKTRDRLSAQYRTATADIRSVAPTGTKKANVGKEYYDFLKLDCCSEDMFRYAFCRGESAFH